MAEALGTQPIMPLRVPLLAEPPSADVKRGARGRETLPTSGSLSEGNNRDVACIVRCVPNAGRASIIARVCDLYVRLTGRGTVEPDCESGPAG